LAIVAFVFAATLGPGDVLPFALICAASGAALGADLTLLPALFARRMAVVSPRAGGGFGLWSFVSKFTLAFAAVTVLPLLEQRGFAAGSDNPEAALTMLTVLYAIVPCALKVLAIALLLAAPVQEETP
ncbi:MAG: MFS transporter, partial [Gemmobacter sp.]